jgi:hypothetical protein
MKKTIAAVLCLSSLSVFASHLSSTIKDIELNHNARCSRARNGVSFFNLCTGSIPGMGEPSVAYTCSYVVKYNCLSDEGDFGLKIRLREAYNHRTLQRETKVMSVTFQ